MNRLEFEVVVFTDLDGTLLDRSYDLYSSAYMLNELYQRGVLTVPASSKTKAELDAFKSLLEYDAPLISENGAGIVWPESLQPVLEPLVSSDDAPASYDSIVKTLSGLREKSGFKFVGFADMTVDDVCEATGLDGPGAQLAMQRVASEPIDWADSPEHFADFKAHLKAAGLTLTQGGRYFHVMSPVDKGQAALRILSVLTAEFEKKPDVFACGDSQNDLPMLGMADACVVFPGTDGSYLEVGSKPRICAKAAGALPWLESVNQLILHESGGQISSTKEDL